MAPPAKRPSSGWYEDEILAQVREVGKKVDESLAGIKQLRIELGIDQAHGRLPTLEAAIARLDRQQEDDHKALLKRIEELDDCIDEFKAEKQTDHGRKEFWGWVRAFFGGAGGAALFGYIAKVLGLIH